MQYNDAEEMLASLKRWQVYLCHWKVDTIQSHYQVILNNNFQTTGEMVYLSVSTSQIEKREDFVLKKWIPKESLVIVEAWEVPFLPKKSCFDCNSVKSCNIHLLYWEHLANKFILKGELPEHILKKIYEGIKLSPLVSDFEKWEIGIKVDE